MGALGSMVGIRGFAVGLAGAGEESICSLRQVGLAYAYRRSRRSSAARAITHILHLRGRVAVRDVAPWRGMLGRRKGGGGGADAPDDIYRGLRNLALDSVANGLALPPAGHRDVSGVVIDIPAQGGFATVVALTDNTTSMYTSTGGGTIGAGEHVEVASATHRLLSAVQAQLGSFKRKDDGDFPAAGSVRFHVLTPTGSRFEDVPEAGFWGGTPHELVPVIAVAQELISAIRGASPS